MSPLSINSSAISCQYSFDLPKNGFGQVVMFTMFNIGACCAISSRKWSETVDMFHTVKKKLTNVVIIPFFSRYSQFVKGKLAYEIMTEFSE